VLVENLPPLGCLLEALFPYHSRTIHNAVLLCVSLKAIFISIYQEGIFSQSGRGEQGFRPVRYLLRLPWAGMPHRTPPPGTFT
jgi:hypothetical protein